MSGCAVSGGGVAAVPAESGGLRSVAGRRGLLQDVVLPGGRVARPVQAADGDAHRDPEGGAEEHTARLGLPCEKGPQGHSDPGECPPPSESPLRCPRGSGGPGVAQRVTRHEGSPARNVVSEEPVPSVLSWPCALSLTAINLPAP